MKRIVYLTIILLSASIGGFAQEFRLNGYANYVFDDQVDGYYSSTSFYDGTIKGGLLWGGGLEFKIHENYALELLYYRQDTEAPVTYFDYLSNQTKKANLDLANNYIMLGGARSMKLDNERIEPYGGLLLGMAIVDGSNPETNFSESRTKFAWGARLGMNIWMSDAVGIKLQAMMLSISQGSGGGLYFGTGGAGAGVSTYSSVFQFALGGGLTFRLKKK